MGNIFRIIARFAVISVMLTTSAKGQIFKDTASLNMIKRGVDSIYNMQFKYADMVYNKISQKYPDHPLVTLYKGIEMYWQNYPLLPRSSIYPAFEATMRKCITKSEKNSSSSNEAEYLLANLCARGLLISFYANNELHNEVFPLATSTYQYIRKSFDFTSYTPDYFFFTGIYNYYREVYPKMHPIYTPLVIFFRKGSRTGGLEELQKAATNSILLKPESYSDLSYIFVSYENDYKKALSFSKHAYDLCPDNPEYLSEYIKNLLLIKKYDDAENLITSSDTLQGNPYFKAQLSILKGIIQEKKYLNNELAEQLYFTGIDDISEFDAYGHEFEAYAYFGLSRICGAKGQKENKKNFRKEGMKLADLKTITFD